MSTRPIRNFIESCISCVAAMMVVATVGVVALGGGRPAIAAGGKHAAIVIDANSGRVLHAQSADAERYPASLTKMMTLYLAFELMEQGRLKPSTPIRISENAAAAAPSRLGLEAGATIDLESAIKALVTKSANDVALAIAEHIAGSEAAFARLMTTRARQLGMKATRFANPHGLPDPTQVTTARDMATLSLALYDHFPRHARVFAMRSFNHAGAVYRNHNTMLGRFEGMEGIKTGYTRASGFNLAASVRRDGRHVVAVVMGGASAASRNAEMRVLLTRALPRASTERRRQQIVRATPTPSVKPPRKAPIRVAEAPAVQQQPHDDRRSRPAAPPSTLVEAPRPADPPIHMTRVKLVPVVGRPRAVPVRNPETIIERAPDPSPAPAPRLAPAPPERARPHMSPPLASPAPATAPDTESGRLRTAQPASPALPSSSLQTSAARPPFALSGPPPKAVAPLGEFAIQIGAFASPPEAERQLANAHRLAPGPLAAAVPRTEPVTQGTRQLYRARFAGFDGKAATRACLELRRHRVDCFVTKER